MDKFFKLSENNTSVKTEIMAGLTTFLTMAYIIAVNPSILSAAGMDKGALVTATCLAAGLTTIFMGIYANAPFALASGMGLNAFFAFTVCNPKVMNVPWQVALTAVFIEGIIFIILSVTNVREAVVNSIPMPMKHAVSAGIGLFIAFIGMQNVGIIILNESTKVTLGSMITPSVIITCIGLFLIAFFESKHIKGGVLWSIFLCSAIAWAYAGINPEAAAASGIYLPSGVVAIQSLSPIAGKLDFSVFSNTKNILNFITIMLTFLFVDFFDTVGTLVGVCSKANLLDANGNVPMAKKALLVDAIGTTGGALLGVSTVTTFVESASGVGEGGRTGLTALTAGVLFIVAMIFSPIFMAIPSCATAACLIYIGFLMMESVTKIDFGDFTQGLPAFVTIALMPLAYSIGTGLALGVITYTLTNLINNIFGRKETKKKISIVMYVLTFLFILKFIFMK